MGPQPHSNAWPELCGGLPSGWVICWPSCPVPTCLHLPTEKLWAYHPVSAALGSVQFRSAAQSCPTLCDPMNHSTPGFPVHHQLPESYPNPYPSSRWCHPAISSSVVPFSSCPQSLPASGSFPMSQLFAWGGQSIGVSASASVLPTNTQDWSPLGWTGWVSLGSLRSFHDCWVHFKFDLFEENRIVPEEECVLQVYSVCLCVWERGKGGRGRVRRRRREEDTQRFSGWPMNEPLEVGGEETWPLGSCPTASLLGNRLLDWGSLL